MRRSFVTVVYVLQLMALRRKIKFYLGLFILEKKWLWPHLFSHQRHPAPILFIAFSQVTTLLNRERQLLQERKLLNREFERLKLEKSRPGYNRIREPPQRLSDLLSTANTGTSAHEPAVRLDLMSPRDDGYLRELDGIGSRTSYNGISRDRVIL